MAELFVRKVIDLLADFAVNSIKEKVSLVLGAGEDVANISSKLKTIAELLHDAEKRRVKETSVGIWLEKIEDVTYEMEDVLEEWNLKIEKSKVEGTHHQNSRIFLTLTNKVRSFFPSICSCLKKVSIRSDVALKIKKMNEQLELTLKEADQFKFISSRGILDSHDFEHIMTTSIIDEKEVYGRTSDKDTLLDQVLCETNSHGTDRVQVISIVGAGGSGKTTLAQLLYNDDQVKNHFGALRKWICVSEPFDLKRIAKAILETPERTSLDSLELESLLQLMKETFSGNKFLLVLDDVWTEEDSKWKPLKDSLKDGAPGSKILVTTRSLRVARVVGTTHSHQMTLLSDSDCWFIMKRLAFSGRSEEWCRKVETIGSKIAEKCKGLPLAARTMGSLLRFKDTAQQWQNILDSEIWQLKEAAVDLFPHLYLSYNELSPELKRCFSYCAVFPKDHVIYVEELIRLWMAQGYIRPNRRVDRLELIGLEYFNNLAMHSFFQELEIVGSHGLLDYVKCKMHDIVHDFAQFLTKNECHVLERIHYELQCTRRNSSSERSHHLTWLGTEDAFSSTAIDFGRLRSFLSFSHGEVVPSDLIYRMKCVRTLILSNCELNEVSSEVGSLIHLRYLDLSHNTFRVLPEAICDLYYLETFDISFCRRLSYFPQRTERLVHLKYLFNHETDKLLHMPQGLGKLASLCSLTKFIARSNYDDYLGILKYLNQLERLDIIVHGEVHFGSAELGKKIYMREMSLEFSEGAHFEETPSWVAVIELPPNLKQLSLCDYPGTHLPSWLVAKSLIDNLTKLSISGPNISCLPALWKLSSLEELMISQLEKLECLGKEFIGITEALANENSRPDSSDTVSDTGSTSSTEVVAAFPNLKKLCFYFLLNWKKWEDLSEDDEKGSVISIMPRLEKLEFVACGELEDLPLCMLGKISSLNSLEIHRCEKLEQRHFHKTGDSWKKMAHIPQVFITP